MTRTGYTNILGIQVDNQLVGLGVIAGGIWVLAKVFADNPDPMQALLTEGQNIAATTGTIEERVAQLVEKLSVIRKKTEEDRRHARQQIAAIVRKYRAEIVAAIAAFRLKHRAYLDGTLSKDLWEKAKADLRLQILAIIEKISTEIGPLRINLNDIRHQVQQARDGIRDLRFSINPQRLS